VYGGEEHTFYIPVQRLYFSVRYDCFVGKLPVYPFADILEIGVCNDYVGI
jgi:hypothetical protein